MKTSRDSCVRFLATALLLASAAFTQERARPTERPNLLVVLVDQWRGQALGFLGQEAVQTPHLDRLAGQSLVLTNAVSNYPVCSPYRAMFMTGKYPHQNGVLSNCNTRGTEFGCELRKSDRCWSDVLAAQGYALAWIGKWHLEAPRRPYVKSYNNSERMAWNEWTPPDRRHGFEFWYAYNTFDRHLQPEYWATDTPRDGRIKIDQWGPEHETDVAIRYLHERDASKPFAMVVSMNPPHMPYEAVPPKYVERYAGKSASELLGERPDLQSADSRWGKYTRRHLINQYAMMTGVDEQVGRLLAALDELELTQDTIVLFTSDHGDCLGLHGEISKNNHYELSMRVPFLIRWPGSIPARHDELMISTPDIYPTLLGLMGLAAEVPAAVQGTSHAALFLTGKGPRPSSQLYLFMPPGEPSAGRRGVRTARYTLMIEKREDRSERVVLHENQADPYQVENTAAQQPELVERLRREELEAWLRRTGDPWLGSR